MKKAKVTQTEAALAALCSEAGLNSQEISKTFLLRSASTPLRLCQLQQPSNSKVRFILEQYFCFMNPNGTLAGV